MAILTYLLCGALLADLLGEILLHPLRIGHDQALHFEMARLLLHGNLPYVDMLDSNPPLIYYLDTIPAVGSQYFQIPPSLAFNLFVWLIALISLLATGHILFRRTHLYHFFYLAPLLVALTVLSGFTGYEFGQREHLFVLLYTPFFFLRLYRRQGESFHPGESILLGLMAGLGTCLKHYFVFVAAALEIFWLIQDRRYKLLFTPEVYAASLVALVYVLHFLFVPAAMREAYFSFIVPLYSYGYIFWDAADIFILNAWGVDRLQILLALLLLAQLMPRRSSLLPPITVLTLAALVIFDYQGKGWTYQAIPTIFGGFLLIALAASLSLSYLARKLGSNRTMALSILLTFGCTFPLRNFSQHLYEALQAPRFDLAQVGYKGTCADLDLAPYAKTILQYTKLGDTVLFLGNGVFPAFPALLQTNRTPASRHLNAIVLSLFEIVENQNPLTKEHKRLLAYKQKVLDQYIADIETNRPKLIFIQQAPVERYLEPYDFRSTTLRDYEVMRAVEDMNVYRRIK